MDTPRPRPKVVWSKILTSITLLKEEKTLTSITSASKKSLQRPLKTRSENRLGAVSETRRHHSEEISQTQTKPSWSHQDCLKFQPKNHSFPGSFVSIPEIQARNKVLKHCGLPDEEYLVLFTPNYKDAMMLVGESYPFFRGNFCMTN